MFWRSLARTTTFRLTFFGKRLIASSVGEVNGESEGLKLSFIEEPIGFTAEHGFGYPQLHFGQRIGPNSNFEILHKLGWGGYTSVWLAKDLQEEKYVALKALSTYASSIDAQGINQEVEFTSTVTHFVKANQHLTPYCAQYLSHFTQPSLTQGEEHLCLVLELYNSDVDHLWAQFPNRIMPIQLVKRILRHILHGLAQLHALNCVHTDLKAGNIFLRPPYESVQQSVKSVLNSDPSVFNPPEPSLNGLVQSAKSQPLPPPDLESALQTTFVLGDLGHVQLVDAQMTPFISPELYRALESIMLGPWGTPVDVWAFGCFVSHHPAIYVAPAFTRQHEKIPPDYWHIAQMIKYTGQGFPVDILKEYQQATPYIDMNTGNYLRNPTLRQGILRERVFHLARLRGRSEHDTEEGFALIEKCLQLNPAERPQVLELLRSSSWLMELGPLDF